jgi:protein-tyrosine phosphatase/membrane-associated phospholipid phosphatase
MNDKTTFWQRALASAWLSFCFVLVYNGCNYITSLRHDVETCAFAWEIDLFAFIPILIIPYWSIDLLFVLAPLFMKEKFLLGQHVKRITFGIFVSGVFFLLFPLELAFQRPDVDGWLAPFFSSLENFNNFYNCAPSLHIVLLTNLWAVYFRLTKGPLRYLMYVWFVLIEASTLFCYQHHIMDIVTGQILGLICLWLFPSEPFVAEKTDLTNRINSSWAVAKLYGVGCLFLVVLSVVAWPTGMWFLWPAASLAVLTAAYAGGGPTLLRKHNGRQLLGTRWLLNPYRWVSQQTANYFNREGPAYAELEPGLFVGRRLTNAESGKLEVEAVLDLTAEYDECDLFLKKRYLNVPVLDLTCPSKEQLQKAVEFIQQNPNCYIHCSLGRGRAGLVAVAYLVSQGLSADEAIARVREVRPNLHLVEGYDEVLG